MYFTKKLLSGVSWKVWHLVRIDYAHIHTHTQTFLSFIKNSIAIKSWFWLVTVSGTFPVTVYGSFLPRHIFYHFHALCAYLRCLFVAFCVLFMWHSFDVILADQVSVVIPILKLKRSTKVAKEEEKEIICEFKFWHLQFLLVSFSLVGCILLPFSRLVAGSTFNFH